MGGAKNFKSSCNLLIIFLHILSRYLQSKKDIFQLKIFCTHSVTSNLVFTLQVLPYKAIGCHGVCPCIFVP